VTSLQSCLDGHRPGGVDAPAERCEQADAPVTELVAEALDDDGPVGWQPACRQALVGEVGDQVRGGHMIEGMVALEPRNRVIGLKWFELAQE
jgi:hypothetical protein